MNGQVRARDAGAGGKILKTGRVERRAGMRVNHLPTGLAMEVDMLMQVGAVARLPTLQVHLLDQARRAQVLQAIVNRGQRNGGLTSRGAGLPGAQGRSRPGRGLIVLGQFGRPARLDALKHLIGRGVIRGGGKHLKNLAAMRGQAHIGPHPKHRQAALQPTGTVRLGDGGRSSKLLGLRD